jgi:hypothetical protein
MRLQIASDLHHEAAASGNVISSAMQEAAQEEIARTRRSRTRTPIFDPLSSWMSETRKSTVREAPCLFM